MEAVAVAFSIAWLEAGVEPQPEDAQVRGCLAVFRRELYRCFTARAAVRLQSQQEDRWSEDTDRRRLFRGG